VARVGSRVRVKAWWACVLVLQGGARLLRARVIRVKSCLQRSSPTWRELTLPEV
jgi:hypothetical protein